MFVLAALVLAQVTSSVGDQLAQLPGADLLFQGGYESARSILSSIASAAITLTALVFSITMLVLQLAASQYTPRLLRSFLKDRNSQFTLGVFAGTFTFALAALRTIRAEEDSPGFAVSVAVLLALVTVFVFIQYIDHIAKRIQISSIMHSIAKETRAALDAWPADDAYPVAAVHAMAPEGELVVCPAPGVITHVNVPALVRDAAEADAQVEVLLPIGEFVPSGAAIVRVRRLGGNDEELHPMKRVTIGPDRTMDNDPAFGLRQLIDIVERALSPSTNDPTTAVQALDLVHDILRRIVQRPTPSGVFTDDRGQVRLQIPQRQWDDFLDLAVDEALLYGRGSLQVTARLRRMLEDLLPIAPEERTESISAKLRAVEGARENLVG